MFTKKQQVPTDLADFEMIKKNEYKVQSRYYIYWGTVLILTYLFYVPKGQEDIRLVYDLTTTGLNDEFWAPKFWMPFVDNIIDVATKLQWFRDIYAADMFHIYNISESLKPYACVDV